MSQRIEAGEEITEPRKQLLKLSIPPTSEKALEGVALLRADLKRLGHHEPVYQELNQRR